MSNDDLDRAESIASRRDTRRSRGRGRGSQTDETNNTGQTDQSSEEDNTSQTSKTDDSNNTPVREQTHVAMYLDETLAEDLDFRFEELNLRYRREHGEKMTKNGEFYPALVRAAVNDTTLTDELGLDDE